MDFTTKGNMFIGLKFILARAFKVQIFGFHSMRSPSHVTTLPSWAEVAITFLAEEKSNVSITKREWHNVLILPTPQRSSPDFENVQWDTADTCT